MKNSTIIAKNNIINRLDEDMELKRAIVSVKPDFLSDTIEPTIGNMRSVNVFDRIFIGEPKDDATVVLCFQVSNAENFREGFKSVNVQIDFYVNLTLMDVPSAMEIDNELYFYNRADYIMEKLVAMFSNKDIKGFVEEATVELAQEMPPFNANSKFNKNTITFTTANLDFDNVFESD